jgi:hypothetical protein
MKNQDQIIANLIAHGGREVTSRSAKYRSVVFETPVRVQIGKVVFNLDGPYFVGKAGALRKGRVVSEAVATTDMFRYAVLSAHTAPTAIVG